MLGDNSPGPMTACFAEVLLAFLRALLLNADTPAQRVVMFGDFGHQSNSRYVDASDA